MVHSNDRPRFIGVIFLDNERDLLLCDIIDIDGLFCLFVYDHAGQFYFAISQLFI